MPSQYLQGPDLELFGVELIAPPVIMRASSLIDTYLRRPLGCIWEPDANGMPAYMAGAKPSLSLVSQVSLVPGLSVIVPLPGSAWDDSILGQSVVIGRNTTEPVEVTWIEAYSPGRLVLAQVSFNHAGPVTLDLGMAIMEESELPSRRSVVQLSQWPISRIISGLGRYGYGRRDQQETGYFDDVNLLAALSTFGGAPTWEAFDIRQSSYNTRTGEYWVPSSLLLSYFTETRIRYIGGWSADGLPDDIKIACATTAQAIEAAAMGPLARRFNTGKVDIQRFTDSVLDTDTKRVLRQYQATALG